MGKLKDVIHLKREDLKSLINAGSDGITLNGTNLVFDEDNVYVTEESLGVTIDTDQEITGTKTFVQDGSTEYSVEIGYSMVRATTNIDDYHKYAEMNGIGFSHYNVDTDGYTRYSEGLIDYGYSSPISGTYNYYQIELPRRSGTLALTSDAKEYYIHNIMISTIADDITYEFYFKIISSIYWEFSLNDLIGMELGPASGFYIESSSPTYQTAMYVDRIDTEGVEYGQIYFCDYRTFKIIPFNSDTTISDNVTML